MPTQPFSLSLIYKIPGQRPGLVYIWTPQIRPRMLLIWEYWVNEWLSEGNVEKWKGHKLKKYFLSEYVWDQICIWKKKNKIKRKCYISYWNFLFVVFLFFLIEYMWPFGMFQKLFLSLKCYLFIHEFIQQLCIYCKLCVT